MERPQAATDLGPGPTVQAEPRMDGTEPAKPQNTKGMAVDSRRRVQRQLQEGTSPGSEQCRAVSKAEEGEGAEGSCLPRL